MAISVFDQNSLRHAAGRKLSVRQLSLMLFVASFGGSLLFANNTTQLAITGLAYWPMALMTHFNGASSSVIPWKGLVDVKLLIALVVFAFLSILWSPWSEPILVAKEVVRLVVTAGLVLLFVLLIRRKVDVDPLLTCGIVVVMTLLGLYLAIGPVKAILAGVNQGTYYWDVQLGILRPGILYHQATTAWMFGMSFFLALSVLGKFGRLIDLFASIGVFISLVMVIFAHSRGAYVGVAVGILFYFTTGDIRKIPLVALGLLMAATAFLCLYYFTDIEAVDMLIDRADSGRLEVWRYALGEIAQNPIIGHGFAASSVADNGLFTAMHFHSVYVAVLFYGGVVGLVLFLTLACTVILKNYRLHYNRGWCAVFVMALAIFLVDGNHILTYPSAELYICVLPILAMAANRQQHSQGDARLAH